MASQVNITQDRFILLIEAHATHLTPKSLRPAAKTAQTFRHRQIDWLETESLPS